VPLDGRAVPIHAHRAADPDKGTGIAMVCTFGDLTDVTWWRDLHLPTRPVMGRDGRLRAEPYAGLTATQARARIVADLRATGALLGEPRPIRHAVKFFEKGDRPLEIVTSRQWYLRNGGRDAGLRQRLLDLGRQLAWHPDFMRARYEHWVSGLTGDWLISRQRFFGVPIPVWYRVGRDGEVRYDDLLLPGEDALPVDPATDCPPGCAPEERGRPGGFVGDPDVMDTWATSSLTPYIVGGDNPRLPMDLRPQAHEIIRTWLFSTVLRAELADGVLPWRHVAISGWIVDPDRKKMSKSKGEAVTPQALLDEYGSDAARYWAARGRPGGDTVFDTGQMRIGRRLATKVLNASRFVLGLGATAADAQREPIEVLDRAALARLAGVVCDATAALDDYDYARALERVEPYFWWWCDDYIELVKERAYGGRGAEAAASATAALAGALSTQLRLLAPYLPFVTEEAWSWWQDGSVHAAAWPGNPAPRPDDSAELLLTGASDVLAAIRRAKTAARRPMREPVARVVLRGSASAIDALRPAVGDLRDAGRVGDLTFEATDARDAALDVAVTLDGPA
jgi:valyl-tRNA synthetase